MPLLSLKVPAWQSLQSSTLSCAVMVAPSSPMAVPAGHIWQSSTLSWAEAVVPSSVRYELAGQIVHVPAPGDEYEPAAHTEHGPASAEKVPAAQRPQESHDPLPATSALVLVPSEPGPHEQVRVPAL